MGAWAKVPAAGKLQMLIVIGFAEFASELYKPHYMTPEGTPGKIVVPDSIPSIQLFDPAGFTKNMPEDVKARRRLVEIQNGRLAMIGIISFLSANAIDGAVPALPPNF